MSRMLPRVALAALLSIAAFPAAADIHLGDTEPVRPKPRPDPMQLAQGATGQTTPSPQTEPIPVTPECAPEVEVKPDHCDTLSEQLDATDSVIEPPTGIDGGIFAPAPDPMPGTTPVIPPRLLPNDPPTTVDEGDVISQ